MEDFKRLQYVDRGANFYLRAMGDAIHMEIIDNGVYEMMHSISDVNNLSSIYNIRLDDLSDDEMKKVIKEIEDIKTHVWWPLAASEKVMNARFPNGDKPVFKEDDFEIYGVMLPNELPQYEKHTNDLEIKRVESLEEFEKWCNIDNQTEHGGMVVFHPQNHYHLIESSRMICFLGYVNKKPVTTCAILNNEGIDSLEFVSTLLDHRNKRYARAICQYALKYAFDNGAKVVSIRAIGDSRKLAKSLGFKFVVTG